MAYLPHKGVHEADHRVDARREPAQRPRDEQHTALTQNGRKDAQDSDIVEAAEQ